MADKKEKVSREEQEYLDRMERQVQQKQAQEIADRELRRREQEKLRESYKPSQPLYSKTQTSADSKNSYQNDPRYKEYYDRLKKSRSDNSNNETEVDDALDAITMDDLDSHEWNQPKSPGRPTHRPQPSASPVVNADRTPTQTSHPGKKSAPPPATDLAPGAIVRIDDGSIAIFKDAVSGKDYALFYFLERNGTMAARGIFLQQYESRRIGHMPAELLEKMLKAGRWERDAIIFHLERYEYTRYIKPVDADASIMSLAESNETPYNDESLNQMETPRPDKPASLVRGRHFRINFSGKIWDAVYWTSDAMGPIVAHSTLGKWSLMHLDLERFKDSLELGEMAEDHEIRAIERSLSSN